MTSVATWPSQAESWLDQRGKPAWIVAMILGFIIFWPVGLALLAYMIWSKRMFNCSHNGEHGWQRARTRHRFKSSGNSAFDAYKADTIARLEAEQEEFEAFLKRLRDAKDKAEFDQFMDEQRRNADAGTDAPASPGPAGPAGA